MAGRVVVLGGGIAGLSAAWHLARAGAQVILLEREKLLASLASGRNAAIFRVLDGDATAVALALSSRGHFDALPSDVPLLRVTGGLYLGERAELDALAARARLAGVQSVAIDLAAAVARVPALAGTDAPAALFEPDDGVLDIHALCEAIARGARAAGASLRTGTAAARLAVRSGRVEGVVLADGAELAADAVVIAAGAWAAELAESGGAHLPISAVRRHLALLGAAPAVPANAPVVWRLGEEVYFRPETGAVLASPCDEEPWPAADPPSAPEALERLAGRLARTAPALSSAPVRRAWACLRTFAPDRGFVAGPDPRVEGLHWLAALGGHGMTCGLGLGEVAAAGVLGRSHALASALAPGRLLGRGAPLRALVFDLDGTLADTLDDLVAAVAHVLDALHLPARSRDEVRSFIGGGAAQLVRRAMPTGREDLYDRALGAFRARYGEHLLEATRPFDGVPEALAALARRNVAMAVLSNKPHALTEKIVRALFPDVPFRAVLGDRPDAPRKPDPTTALELARLMGLAPGEVGLVGDGTTDVLAARAAGMRAIAVRWGYRPVDELVRAGADQLLASPAELLTLA